MIAILDILIGTAAVGFVSFIIWVIYRPRDYKDTRCSRMSGRRYDKNGEKIN